MDQILNFAVYAETVASLPEAECRCGHDAAAHEHYRRGTDCALCDCVKFKA